MRRRRMGRPGLVGTMARTAVVAGTATAVVGGVSNSRQNKQAAAAQNQAAEQAAFESQAELADMQQQMAQMQAQQAQPPAAAAGDDLMGKISQLAELHASGVLDDAEFAAAKAKLLGT